MSFTEGGMTAAPTAAPERVIVRLRPHARVLFWPTMLLFAVCGAVGYFVGVVPETWMVIALVVGGAALVVLGWLLPLAAWLARSMTVTTRRLILRRGLFVRSRQEMMLSRGSDITIRRSWVQSAFRTGDVSVSTGDRPLVLRDVPNPELVQETLHELIEQTKMQPALPPHQQ